MPIAGPIQSGMPSSFSPLRKKKKAGDAFSIHPLTVTQLRDSNPWTIGAGRELREHGIQSLYGRRRRQFSRGHSAGAELVVEPRGKARRDGNVLRETQPEGSLQAPWLPPDLLMKSSSSCCSRQPKRG